MINPAKKSLTPARNIAGMYVLPILDAVYEVPQNRLTIAKAMYPAKISFFISRIKFTGFLVSYDYFDVNSLTLPHYLSEHPV